MACGIVTAVTGREWRSQGQMRYIQVFDVNTITFKANKI